MIKFTKINGFAFQCQSTRYMKSPLSTAANSIYVKDGDTRHTIYVTYKIYLLLKFIEIHKVSVNHFYNDNKSDYHELQKFQETSILLN